MNLKGIPLKQLLILMVLLCTSCSNDLDNNTTVIIPAQRLVNDMNAYFTEVTLKNGPSDYGKHNYYYLELPKNSEIKNKINHELKQYIFSPDRQCFQYAKNRHGWHITLTDNATEAEKKVLSALVGHKYKVIYSNLYVYRWTLPHTHTTEVVYAVEVVLNSADYKVLTGEGSYLKHDGFLHVSLGIFRIDQNKQCVKWY